MGKCQGGSKKLRAVGDKIRLENRNMVLQVLGGGTIPILGRNSFCRDRGGSTSKIIVPKNGRTRYHQ